MGVTCSFSVGTEQKLSEAAAYGGVGTEYHVVLLSALQGIDQRSMGSGFLTTAGRILGHLGDVMTLAFTPAAPSGV